MSDLMIKKNNNIIDTELLTQNQGYTGASKRYIPISSQNVLDTIQQYTGNTPEIIGFNRMNTRKAEKQHFVQHALMLQMPDAEMLDGTSYNIILFNSNDRSSSLKIYTGAGLRAACSNQLIFSDNDYQEIKIRHTTQEDDWKHSIYGLMDNYAETQKQTQDMIDRMMNTYTSYGTIGRICERVSEEILEPSITGSVLDPLQLNIAHRKEDTGKTAWTLYNRIQGSIMQGGIDRIISKEDEEKILFDSISHTHKVTDSKKQIKMNQELHKLVLEMV